MVMVLDVKAKIVKTIVGVYTNYNIRRRNIKIQYE